MSISEIRQNARLALHRTMARPAVFYSSEAATPEDITARKHDKQKLVGDLAGTNLSYAETHDRPTKLVFWKADMAGLTIRRNSMVIFAEDEGWNVGSILPDDGYIIEVEVTEMRAADLVGKQLPDGSTIGA
jgi:hypothetical protein